MIPAGILETSLYAADLIAAEQFYADVLGLPVHVRAAGRHVFFRLPTGMLLVFNPTATQAALSARAALPVPPHGAIGPGHVCFRASAEEIDRWRQRLIAHGVTIESDFVWPSGGRSLYFRDPAGNSLEFAEPKIWSLP